MQAGQGLSIEGRGDDADRDLQMFQGLALIRSGHGSEGADLRSNLIRKLEREKLVGSAAATRLAIAEAWVAVGDRRMALGLLGDALNFFESHQVFESLWRAHALSGKASEDPQEAETHRNKATMVLSQLKARWSAENFAGYMRRPAIRQLSEQ